MLVHVEDMSYSAVNYMCSPANQRALQFMFFYEPRVFKFCDSCEKT
jgi:hypothetical protein